MKTLLLKSRKHFRGARVGEVIKAKGLPRAKSKCIMQKGKYYKETKGLRVKGYNGYNTRHS